MQDFSSFMQMINEMNKEMPNNSENNETSSTNDNKPDIETMMKLAKIMNTMNSTQNSASTNLLYALKPFLRESKKEKVDQYAQFLKMSSILNEMNKSGGDHL